MSADARLAADTVTGLAAADVERYAKMRARLVAASEALARATSPESAAVTIGSALVTLTGAQHAAVFFRSMNGVVTCPWYHNLSEVYVRELITPEGVNPWIHLVRHPELACMDLPRGGRKRPPTPWLLPDVCELPIGYTVRQRVQREGLRSICSWPLSRAGQTIGAVAYYFDAPHLSSAQEQEILRVFASQAAMAVEHGITARALKRGATSAEVPTHSPVRIHTGLEVDAIRLAETLRAQDLAIERPPLTEGLTSLQAEYRRLADAQHALRSEAEQLAQARAALDAEAARVADNRGELTAEGARLAEARENLEAERTRLADIQAQTGLAVSEQRRLADARREIEEEQARLIELQRDGEAREARLSQERAVLSAERASLAAAQHSHTVETERLAEAREHLEAERTRLADMQAQAGLAVFEQRRLADARREIEEGQARLTALQRDSEARLSQERAVLSAERASLQAEHRRLADAQAEFAAQHERLADGQAEFAAQNERLVDAQRALRSEAEQLAQARAALNAEAARVADSRGELTAEGARLAEARGRLEAERTQLADAQAKLDAAETALSRDRQLLRTEEARITAARQEVEAALREAGSAQAGLAVSEQRRLADARREIEEEQARLIALQRDGEAREARLSQERAVLSAERASLAAAQDLHAVETERLAETQRQIEAERAALQAEHRRLADAQAEFAAQNERLADAQRALRSEAEQLAQARAALDAEAARVADSRGELTAEGARLAEAREHLELEQTRLADVQAKLDAAETALSRDLRLLRTEEARITAGRQEVEDPQTPALDANIETEKQWRSNLSTPGAPAPEAGETTYKMLVQRIGAPDVEDDDRQIAMVADLLDARNGYAEGYSKSLVGWVETLARELSCSEPEFQAVRRAALLNGIGTIDVPESTLRKSSDLTADEQTMLRGQPVVAHRVLNGIEWLRPAAAILRHRFERWDGTGQPDRLKGNAIPSGARILAVAEAYGAMVMGRPGGPTLYYLDAIAALKRGAGTQFDPTIVGAFCQIIARARVGRLGTHDGVVALLKDMAPTIRGFVPMNREDELLQNTL